MAKNKNKTQVSTYWQDRAERNYLAGEKDALQLAKELKSNYEKAVREINEKINSFYGQYGLETKLTLEEAKKLLNKNELKDFKSYINEMLKFGEKKNFSQEELYEFRRLYNKAKITRLEKLQSNIRAELDKLAVDVNDKVENLLSDTYENEYYKSVYDYQMGFDTDNAFTGLNKEAIKKAVNQKYLKDNYSSRIWKNNTKLLNTLVTQDIPRGITLGYNPKKLSSDIISKRVNKTLYNNVVRLVRTEYSHILNKAALDGYKSCGIKQYKILTTLDNRRCEDCGDYDGNIVNINEAEEGINMPPFHPNCRCTTIPYFEDDYIDEMSNEELDRIGFVTYDDWKNGLVKFKDNKVIYNWRKGLNKE